MHWPEQHCPCEVQVELSGRQLPRHWPSWQSAPAQHSPDCEQVSSSNRHCERQVWVVGLQKPTQHSASSWQATPAAVQATARHRPALQLPSQQSFVSLQAAPVTPHAAARHKAPAQLDPEQQSDACAQPWPGTAQVPSPTQRFERQLFEQHVDPLEQPSPLAPQPHTPSFRHCPSQQSLWKLQVSPAGLHGSRHWPSTHEPSQHSALAPQLVRSRVHAGGGGAPVGPHASRKRPKQQSARSRTQPPYRSDLGLAVSDQPQQPRDAEATNLV